MICNLGVVGSNPTGSSNAAVAQLVEHNLAKVRVAGSNPVCRSNGSLVELVTISHCHCEGHGFDSHTNRKLEVSQYAFQSN